MAVENPLTVFVAENECVADAVIALLAKECIVAEAIARPMETGSDPLTGTSDATLSGTLAEIEYLGPVTRFSVTLADGAAVHLMALTPPTTSGQVTVAWFVPVVGAACRALFRGPTLSARRGTGGCSATAHGCVKY